VKWFRGGLVFKAHRLVYNSNVGLRVIKKKKTGRDLIAKLVPLGGHVVEVRNLV